MDNQNMNSSHGITDASATEKKHCTSENNVTERQLITINVHIVQRYDWLLSFTSTYSIRWQRWQLQSLQQHWQQ